MFRLPRQRYRESLHLSRASEDALLDTLSLIELAPATIQLCRSRLGASGLLTAPQSAATDESDVESEGGILEQVFRPLLSAGLYAPFPVVVYLSAGYIAGAEFLALGRGAQSLPESVRHFIPVLASWLHRELRFTDPDQPARRSWIGVQQFVQRSLAALYPAPSSDTGQHMVPEVCDSRLVTQKVWHVEQLLEAGGTRRSPVGQTGSLLALAWHLRGKQAPLERRAHHLRQAELFFTEFAERMRQATQRQAAPQQVAHSFYVVRAGIADDGHQAEMLDLHALAGYQAYGVFRTGRRIELLLEQLRRQISEPIVKQHLPESSVDGMSRRGNLSQLLRWQLALPTTFVYDRYFNHKLHYLQRVTHNSQDLYLSFVVAIDAARLSRAAASHGGRLVSIGREVAAHVLQDAFQVLHRVPQLHADAFVFLYAGDTIRWQTMLTLADGSGRRPAAIFDDIFLQERPNWMRQAVPPLLPTSDPATMFRFMLPLAQPGTRGLTLHQRMIEQIWHLRLQRIEALRGRHGRQSVAALLSAADLMTVINITAPQQGAAAGLAHAAWNRLGADIQHWLCQLETGGEDQDGDWISLLPVRDDGRALAGKAIRQSLEAFQRDPHANDSTRTIRRRILQQVLEGLLDLCAQSEMRA